MGGFDAAYSYGSYEGPLRELVHIFKYGGVQTLAKPFGRFLIAALPFNTPFDVVVPMPMHWFRRWRRGFNQAELLARALTRHTGLPLVHALRRAKSAKAQAGLTRAERRRNVMGAFAPAHAEKFRGKRVLLVDDVLTTGYTARAASSVLKRAGAARVTVITLARADRRHWLEGLSGSEPQSIALGAN